MTPISIKQRLLADENVKVVERKVASEPSITRLGLAKYICAKLSFKDPKGDLQVSSCLKALRDLATKGVLPLPPPRISTQKEWNPRRLESGVDEPVGVPDRVDKIDNLELVAVPSSDDNLMRIFNELILSEHPQGHKRLVGRQMRYLIRSEHGWLGAIAFSSSALCLEARDKWIGWNNEQRTLHQNDVINMSRFLIIKKVKCKNLASRALGMVARQIPDDFEATYGYRPLLIESFVDTEHFTGTCYQAANFQMIGKTKGRGRNDTKNKYEESIKDIYVYPLDKDFRKKIGVSEDHVTGIRPLAIDHGLDGDNWAEQEFGNAELGDSRLTRRLIKIAEQKSQLQGLPYSQAAHGNSYDKKGYYNFIAKEKESLNFEQILASHQSCVVRRMASLDTVLAIQDTTDLNYTTSRECKDLGSIGTNQTKAEAKGLSLHSCFALTTEGLPLGVLNAACRAPEISKTKIKKAERRLLSIREKTSNKWLESYLDCVAVAKTIPDTKVISIMDREADIFELYEHVLEKG